MKIDRPGRSEAAGPTRKTKRTAAADQEFGSLVGDASPGAEQSASVAAAGPVASMDALLSLQEAADDPDARSKGLNRATSLLDHLEEIRHGLLLGQIPMDRLQRLAALARAQREGFSDPRLNAILDEIELRAEVELAKLSISQE